MRLKKVFLAIILIFSLLCFFGCGEERQGEVNNSQEICISTKNTQEQAILAQMASILITENTDHKVKIINEENATSKSLYKDLKDGKIQMYFDYTGSIYLNALELPKKDMKYAVLLVQIQTKMIENAVYVSEGLGYDGGMTLYMTPELREKLGSPANISDLKANASKLTIGMEDSFFSRNKGYKSLLSTYGLKFKEAKVYTEEEGFYALRRGDIDIMVGSRTTVFNNMFNLYLFVDDKRCFISEKACYVADDEFLLSYPEIKETLTTMEGLITSGTMSSIIRKVYWQGNDLDHYLRSFLRARNLL